MDFLRKIRVWDEKYRCWDNGPLLVYPNQDIVKQGRIIEFSIGAKDLNGKDIFVGDFVRFDDVVFDSPIILGIYLVTDRHLQGLGDVAFDYLSFRECSQLQKCLTVVGNKHEDQGILKSYAKT